MQEKYPIYGIEFSSNSDNSVALVSQSSQSEAVGELERFLKKLMLSSNLKITRLIDTTFKSDKQGVIIYTPSVDSWNYFTDKDGKPIGIK